MAKDLDAWHAGGQEFESPLLHSTEAQPLVGFFLLPMRGDDPARCPVLAQKDEAVQALGVHLAKGAGLGI